MPRTKDPSQRRMTRQKAPRDLADLLAIADGELPHPGVADSMASTLTDTMPRHIEWLRWPVEDRAYQLYLRGWTMQAIGRELGCNKETVITYVKAARKDQEPIRREQRGLWLMETIARLRNVQAHAWEQWDQTGEYGLLNTITVAEREIAKLRGLYDFIAEDAGGDGVTIRITRHEATRSLGAGIVEGGIESEDGASDDGDQE